MAAVRSEHLTVVLAIQLAECVVAGATELPGQLQPLVVCPSPLVVVTVARAKHHLVVRDSSVRRGRRYPSTRPPQRQQLNQDSVTPLSLM